MWVCILYERNHEKARVRISKIKCKELNDLTVIADTKGYKLSWKLDRHFDKLIKRCAILLMKTGPKLTDISTTVNQYMWLRPCWKTWKTILRLSYLSFFFFFFFCIFSSFILFNPLLWINSECFWSFSILSSIVVFYHVCNNELNKYSLVLTLENY